MTGGNLFEGLIGPPAELYRDYARVVTSLDREIGRLLDRIDELGIADDTIVRLRERQRLLLGRAPSERHGQMALRGIHPHSVHRAGPGSDHGSRQAGRPDDPEHRPGSPSLLEMAGLPAPDGMEGQSFVPLLESRSSPVERHGYTSTSRTFRSGFPPPAPSEPTDTSTSSSKEGGAASSMTSRTIRASRRDMIDTEEGQGIAEGLREILEDLRSDEEIEPHE